MLINAKISNFLLLPVWPEVTKTDEKNFFFASKDICYQKTCQERQKYAFFDYFRFGRKWRRRTLSDDFNRLSLSFWTTLLLWRITNSQYVLRYKEKTVGPSRPLNLGASPFFEISFERSLNSALLLFYTFSQNIFR